MFVSCSRSSIEVGLGMDTGRFVDFFQTSRDAAVARMRSLSPRSTVRKARARAEVEFRSREVSANWRNWMEGIGAYPPSRVAEFVPPHWQAGIRFASTVIPAYGEAALDEIGHASDFEDFLRECAWVVADRTYQRKLQPYDSLLAGSLDVAVANFHQLVRAAVAGEVAQLSLKAWQRHQDNLELESGLAPTPKPDAAARDDRCAIAAEAAVQDDSVGELAHEREARLQAFLTANDATIASVCEAAQIYKADMQRWRHGTLNRESVMSQRIESVLSGETPLKANGAMAAESSGG